MAPVPHPHDGDFHAVSDHPDWAESGCFAISVPERDLTGFLYFFHDARMGIAGGGPALWDPSGEQQYDCRFYDWQWRQPPTGTLSFADFTLPNGLRHQVLEPGVRHGLSYDQPGLSLAVEWTALMAPHPLGPVNDDAGHFDHPGRLVGTMHLDGERLDVDCYSMRDRTWGPHRSGATRSGDYLWAVASPQDHWHAITMAGPEVGSGNGSGDVDRVVGGYLVADGQLAELVSGERRVTARRDGAPARVDFDAVDDRGRTVHASGAIRTALRWWGWPGRLVYWTLTDWRWNGLRGWGENQEFMGRTKVRALTGKTAP